MGWPVNNGDWDRGTTPPGALAGDISTILAALCLGVNERRAARGLSETQFHYTGALDVMAARPAAADFSGVFDGPLAPAILNELYTAIVSSDGWYHSTAFDWDDYTTGAEIWTEAGAGLDAFDADRGFLYAANLLHLKRALDLQTLCRTSNTSWKSSLVWTRNEGSTWRPGDITTTLPISEYNPPWQGETGRTSLTWFYTGVTAASHTFTDIQGIVKGRLSCSAESPGDYWGISLNGATFTMQDVRDNDPSGYTPLFSMGQTIEYALSLGITPEPEYVPGQDIESTFTLDTLYLYQDLSSILTDQS